MTAPSGLHHWMDNRVGAGIRAASAVVYAVAAIHATPQHQRWIAVPLVVATLAGAVYAMSVRRRSAVHGLAGLAVAVAAADTLYVLVPHSLGWVVSFAVTPWAFGRLPARWAVPFAVVVTAAIAVIGFLRDSPAAALSLVGGRPRTPGGWPANGRPGGERPGSGTGRAPTPGREIHDILAHTLSAQVVQLENARLLLGRGTPAETVLTQIEQAQRLAREGLAETKRALYSLRGDARPLSETLAGLAAGAGATFTVDGDGQPVGPEVSLALERTVQEALTNVRKHVPGARVGVTLRLRAEGYEVEIRDEGASAPSALADSGDGDGLTGMRERAELLGGRLEAGAVGRGFRVLLSIPA